MIRFTVNVIRDKYGLAEIYHSYFSIYYIPYHILEIGTHSHRKKKSLSDINTSANCGNNTHKVQFV